MKINIKNKKDSGPKGILRGSFEQLFEAGCIQVGGDNQVQGLDKAERETLEESLFCFSSLLITTPAENALLITMDVVQPSSSILK